jgi:hypothetical protein
MVGSTDKGYQTTGRAKNNCALFWREWTSGQRWKSCCRYEYFCLLVQKTQL